MGPQSLDLRRYYDAYKREFRGPSRHSSKEELIQACCRSEILLVGDYHAFAQSQKAALRLLRELIARAQTPLALGLELVPAAHQAEVSAFVAGELSEQEFLAAIDYRRNWGFPWENFRPLFELARARKLEVLALNADSPKLGARDAFAAERLASFAEGHPSHKLFVLYGDLHLARGHLPRHLRTELRAREIRRRVLTVFQNSESLYWRLAQARAIHEVDVLALGRDRYCIMNAAPWVKLQSYLEWAESGALQAVAGGDRSTDRVADDDDDTAPTGPNLHEQAHDRLRHLAGALKLELPPNIDFTVQTVEDLSFLLRNSPALAGLTRAQAKSVKYQVLGHRTVVIPEVNIIYLPSPWVNSLSEGVSLLAHHALSGSATLFHEPDEHFFAATLSAAIAYFGSKVLNHKRKCDLEEDLKRLLALPARKSALPLEKLQRRAAKLALSHCRAQKSFLSSGRYRAPTSVAGPSRVPVFLETARALGAILGEKLYTEYVEGRYPSPKIEQLFRARLDDRVEARKLYLRLVRDLGRVELGHSSKLDLF